MEKLKVCLFSDTVYDMNGVSRFIHDMVQEASTQNQWLEVITSSKKSEYGKRGHIHNIKPHLVFTMPFYASLDVVWPKYFKIKTLLSELNPHIVHISTPGPLGLCALFAARALKIPVLGIYHTDFPTYLYKNTKKRWIETLVKYYLRWFYKDFKLIFSRSLAYETPIRKTLKYKRDDIVTFKSGTNIERFHKRFNDDTVWAQYGISKTAFKALYVGRISVEKNVYKLLRIWKKVNIKNKVLILVGEQEFAIDPDFCQRHKIILLGVKKGQELSTLYASSDCFLFPSTTDTLGQVVMEAMASGLPVVVTTKGGPKTFVHPSCGFCIDMFNKPAWIRAIVHLYEDKIKRETMGNNGFLFMQEHSLAKSFEDFWQLNERFYSLWDKNS